MDGVVAAGSCSACSALGGYLGDAKGRCVFLGGSLEWLQFGVAHCSRVSGQTWSFWNRVQRTS